MKNAFAFPLIVLALFVSAFLTLAMLLTAGWQLPPIAAEQTGYRGTGMERLDTAKHHAAKLDAVVVPAPLPPAAVIEGGPTAGATFRNVKVLGDLPLTEFTRLMQSISSWVAPKEGCAYCHDLANMSSDDKYTKVVARRMLEMTRQINSGWQSHVAQTGVTCFTCHRGNPVPKNIWFHGPGSKPVSGYAGNRAGQNAPAAVVGVTSLPNDPFTPYLEGSEDIRVVSTAALPAGSTKNIMGAEKSYGLMMHLSQALGENCTFCHNSRDFFAWKDSTPQRSKAWYGIRMVRELNNSVLVPLQDVFPANRRGPLGDGPKLNCATCHDGINKPLNGANMIAAYPELAPAAAKPAQ